jgi:hypothetical protein
MKSSLQGAQSTKVVALDEAQKAFRMHCGKMASIILNILKTT